LIALLANAFAAPPKMQLWPGWQSGAGVWDKGGFWRRIRRQIWRRLQDPCLVRWFDGVRLYVEPNEEIGVSIFVSGCYEPNEFWVLDRILSAGKTFVDVGANTGLYSLFAARKVGSRGVVLAMEPSSREFARLRRNIEVNDFRNVRLFQLAISDAEGSAELSVAAWPKGGHNTLGAFGYDTQLSGKELVATVSLDELLRRENVGRVDAIKLDIEGAELLALRGAKETLVRDRPALLLELSDRTLGPQGFSSSQVWDFLCEIGYQVYQFHDRTGLLLPARKRATFDGENVVAFHADASHAPLALCGAEQAQLRLGQKE
jgi:FkbM family methyltransferase